MGIIRRIANAWAGPAGVRELLQIAFPLFISQSCETVMMFTDRLFLSRLGPEYMSAAMAGGLTCFMLSTFFFGLTGYANALVAQHFGSGQTQRCPVVTTQALLISVAAYPVILGCIPVGRWLFSAMDTAPGQIEPQQAYFTILMFGAVFGLLRNSLSAYFSGIGRTRIIMAGAVTSMVVNVAANYILIFGKLGFAPLGIRGAALGTLIGSLAGLLVLVVAYFGKENRRNYAVIAGTRFDLPMMRTLLRFGYPSGLEFFLNMLAFDLLVLTFHSYGLEVAGAVTMAFNWDMVSFIPLIGLNIGVTSLVGRYMGSRSPELAHRATMSGIKIVTLYATLIILTFSLFPEVLIGIFRPVQPDAVYEASFPLAVYMVRLVSVYVFADAIGLVFSGALRGAGDTFMTMCLSVSTHWLLAVASLLMIRVAGLPPRAAWIAVVVLVWCIGLAFAARYRSGKWRQIRMVEPEPVVPPPEAVI